MKHNELPPGWAWSTLGEVVEVLDHKRVPVSAKVRATRPGKVPYYGATGQVGWIDEAIFDEELVLLGEDGVQFFNPQSQKAYLIHGRSWVNNHAHVLRAIDGLVAAKYLVHYLNIFNFEGYANGTTRLKLTKSAMLSIPIPVPPFVEQERIVDALEDHLSRLDVARGLLEVVSSRIGNLCRRIAADLTSVSDEDASLVTLESVSRSVRNGIFVSRPGAEPSGVAILRISAVRPMALDISDIRYTGMDVESLSASGALLREGDILFTRYNGNPEFVGGCAVVQGSIEPLTYPDKLIRVEIDRDQAIPEFIALACNFGSGRRHIRSLVKTTAGQAGVSGRDLKSVPLVLPTVEEQVRRVAEYRKHVEQAKELEKSVKSAATNSATLRSMLMHQAFSGQLAQQDPADEPASALLKRIRAERDAQPKVQRGRASKKAAAASARPAPSISSEPAGTFVQEELGL